MKTTVRNLLRPALLPAIWITIAASATPINSSDAEVAPSFMDDTWSEFPRRLPVESRFPSLQGATEWLNSPALAREGLRGKVVLVQFGTYSCINWIRTLPYVREWSHKYRELGLVVLVVHTPEFRFETNIESVRRALKDLRVDLPVAVDSDYKIWTAFQNNYWPALYFIDASGRIRHHRFGEGDYETSERVIQLLLAEAGAGEVGRQLVSPDAHGVEAAPDWDNLRTRETYVGFDRSENFASPGKPFSKRSRVYSMPSKLRLNEWALEGDWNVGREFAILKTPGGRIAFRFHARDLHLVMGSSANGRPVRFRVLLDGHPPGDSHGVDVDESGNGRIEDHRMYQLIRLRKPVEEHLFEIEFFDAGVEVFSFTFG